MNVATYTTPAFPWMVSWIGPDGLHYVQTRPTWRAAMFVAEAVAAKAQRKPRVRRVRQ